MPDPHHLLLFIAAGLLLNLTPGPDVLYIVSHALRSGVRAGVVAGLGITAGCFVHIVAAAAGVSALMAASSTAFTVLKWAGAGYLLWIGVKMLVARQPAGRAAPDLAAAPGGAGNGAGSGAGAGIGAGIGKSGGLRGIFLGGFWTNVLNPKVALFFLAFVPQFIAPGAPNAPLAFLLLGCLFNFNAIFVNVGWAVLAGWMARRMHAVQRAMSWLDRFAGAMFITFGIKLALADPPTR